MECGSCSVCFLYGYLVCSLCLLVLKDGKTSILSYGHSMISLRSLGYIYIVPNLDKS